MVSNSLKMTLRNDKPLGKMCVHVSVRAEMCNARLSAQPVQVIHAEWLPRRGVGGGGGGAWPSCEVAHRPVK